MYANNIYGEKMLKRKGTYVEDVHIYCEYKIQKYIKRDVPIFHTHEYYKFMCKLKSLMNEDLVSSVT